MFPNFQRLPLILALLTGAAMAAVTAWQAYRFWQVENQPADYATVSSLTSEAFPSREPPTLRLASIELFGRESEQVAPQAIDTENLPETNLRLFLRGVLAAAGEFPGSALIEDDRSQTEAYLVGEELPGNATLRSVYPNRVIIERSGKLENLYFPDDEDRSGMTLTAANEARSAAPSPSAAPAPRRAPANATSDNQRREEIRRRLEQLRERLRNNN